MNNFDHEAVVIGGLVLSSGVIDEIDLMPEDFEIESYRLAYQMIIDMVAAREVVDVITISARMQKAHPGENWIYKLGHAAKNCVSVSSVPAYAEIVKNNSRNRKAKAVAANLLNEIESAESSEDLIDDAVRSLMELSVSRKSHEHSISQALRISLNMIQEAADNEGTVGIPSGIAKLDEVLGGFHDSDLYVIGARPAMGKTALLLNLINNTNEPRGLISAEQPAEQIGIRMIAINGRVNAQKIRTGTLEDFDYTKMTSCIGRLNKENNIWINDKSGIGIMDLIRQARKWKHEHCIKALYVDYVQRIKWTDQRLAKWEQVGNVVMALKELARDLDIPIIALAQVNRDVEKRGDRRPRMGDLANSSEIEKEADCIMTLYRDEVYNPETADAGIMEISVEKNRHGPTGFVRTVWNSKYMRVDNYMPELRSVS